MSTNQRLSPGVYRTSSGQIVHSAGGGGSPGRRPAPARPGAPAAGPYTGTQLNNAGDVLNTATSYGGAAAQQGNRYTNPNQIGPFGNQTVTYGPDGQPTITQGLSQGNQNVLGGVQGNSINASSVLGGLLGGGTFGSLTNGDPNAPLSNYSQAMYSQLTQGNADNKRREGEQLSQTLANRGIPVGSEAYDDQMKQFNQRYDTLDQNARNQAVTGGVNTGISAAGVLGNIGQSGFYNPNFQGFNGQAPQQVDVGGLYGATQSANIAQQQLNKARGGRGGGGGGRSSGGSPTGPVFSNTPIPGSG